MRKRDAEQAALLMRHHVRRSRMNILRQHGMMDLVSSEGEGA